ncbi:MAG: CPBP family intramembrane metalloprotease [Prolixibacteraceae bacterium]|nr:CPBP family intramembrane metalloprotease [Prolixibacteraceae bacterium]
MAIHVFVTPYNKIRNVWWVVIFFLILTSFLFPLIILADRFSFEITMLHQLFLILVVSIICQLLRRKPISDLTGKFNFDWIKQLYTGLMIGAVLMGLPVLLLTILGYIHWQVDVFSFSTLASGIQLFLFAAIAEELLFRGFMFQRLIHAFGNWPAQILVAGLFLLTHINNPGMTGIVKTLAGINIFTASILFGIAFIKTKSLAMPLGLHFMANFMQGTVLGFGVSGGKDPGLLKPGFDNAPVWLSGGDFGIEASLFGLTFVILISVFLYLWNPQKDKTKVETLKME